MPTLAAVLVVLWGLSADDGGFVDSPTGVHWSWAVPTSGPGGGDPVWATNPGGNYFNDAVDTLEIPVGDLSAVAHPVLTVRHWYDIQAGDFGRFEVNDGSGWAPLVPIFGYPNGQSQLTGSSGGWIESSLDLRGYGDTPQVRLLFSSDPSLTAAGWYVEEVALYDGDVTAPAIAPVVLPTDTEQFTGTYAVQVQVVDDTAVDSVTLRASVNAAPLADIAMVDLGAGIYEGLIPAQLHRSVVTWSVEASDGNQSSTFPEVGEQGFVVALRAPSDFAPVDDGSRQVGNRVTFGWTPPDTTHIVDGYRIRAVDLVGTSRTVVDTWWVTGTQTEATVTVQADGPRSFDVLAEYVTWGPSDPSDVVHTDIEVATLDRIQPESAYQGDQVRVRIEGEGLYLSAGDRLIFDGEIAAQELEVESVDRASAVIAIPDGASTGAYGISLDTEWGTWRFNDVFTVLSGADRPRIVSVEPDEVRQGDEARVAITASVPFDLPEDGLVRIEADDDLVIVSDPVVNGERLEVDLVASGGARPGTHTLLLDDGRRLWEADLVIEERVYTGNTGCGGCNGTAYGGAFAPWWLFLILVRRRVKP